MLMTDGFEETEFEVPYDRLLDAGHQVVIVGPTADALIVGKKGQDSRRVELAVSAATAAEFERVMIASDTGVPDLTGVLPDLVQRAGQAETSTSKTGQLAESTDVTSLHAPAFGPDGQVAISLTLNGFRGQESPERLQKCLDRLLAGTSRITNLLGGHTPA
jgi:hypothetical protein